MAQSKVGFGPPSDTAPSDLWRKLQAMPRPHRVVDFPRLDASGEPVGQIAIWVLTQEEQMISSTAAEKWTKEKLKDGSKGDLGYETVFSNEAVVQTLFRALRDPSSENLGRPAFPTPSAIRSLTMDECGRLFEYYLSTQLELGPIIAHLSKEEMDAWIDRLAAGGLAASPFVLLSPDMQKALAHSMAVQIAAFRTGSPSAGSQLEKTPPDEQDEDRDASER